MTGVFERLASIGSRIAGDTLHGLRGAQAAEKASTLALTVLLRLRSEAFSLLAEIHAALEEARRQEREGMRLYAQELADQGRSISEFAWDAAKAPLQLAVCKRYIAQCRDEYGLRDDSTGLTELSLATVIEAVRERATLITKELQARYRRDGEPAEAVEPRRQLREAQTAEWEPRRLQAEAHKRNNGAGGAFEAEALAANAVLAAAEAKTAAVRRELFDKFGIRA